MPTARKREPASHDKLPRTTLRLPLPVAARLAAWCEMHPQRPRHELVAELLDAGLAAAERQPAGSGSAWTSAELDSSQTVYLPTGAFAEFRHVVGKHHPQLEHEQDHDEQPGVSYPAIDYLLTEE